MNRRSLCKVFAAGSALAAVRPILPLPFATPALAASESLKLNIVSRTLEVNGKAAKVFGIEGPNGKPGLTLDEGQTYAVNLINGLAEETAIHWHGLTPAWDMDGVPGMPLPPIAGGSSRDFTLPSGKTGTHWMHAHTLQEQALLAAPLIVMPSQKRDEQDVVILLHDFSFKTPEELLAGLKSGNMGGMNMQGVDHSKMKGMNMNGMSMKGMDHSKMSGMGGMAGMDLNDIEYDAYLANDRTLDDPEVVQVEKGGKVRLRIINGATATGFSIDTGALAGMVVAVDGQDVVPVAIQPFPLGMGQRVDILVEVPKEGGAFPILALREGAKQRTGIVLTTAGAKIEKISADAASDGPILSVMPEHMLRAASPLPPMQPARKFNVVLSGDMQSYEWKITPDQELAVKQGERIAIELQNQSMMTHPMHLHGHHFQIINVDGMEMAGAMRDTVLVPPMASVTFAFDANNPGKGWAFHCHHLYHMATGMMTFVPYV
jgi:FtsP/CotA-like multicopper oxidase with cupredoxin domain